MVMDIRRGIHQGARNVLKNHHFDSRLISLCTYQISHTLRSSSVQFWKFQNVIHIFSWALFQFHRQFYASQMERLSGIRWIPVC